MSNGLVISAIVVTRNREGYLKASLESLMRQGLDRSAYEVVVVDNDSTDGTAALVKAMQERYDNLHYVFAETVGSSRARNAGLHAANASLVAYLDDDAVAPPNWLEEIVAAFRSCTPTPSCIGGKIIPLWESPPPAWFPRRYLPSLSMLDLGDEMLRLEEGKYIVGANMAFVKEDVLKAGGFNDEISLYADEICVQDRLRGEGGTIVYAPKAWVHHHVPTSRLTVEYICHRKYRGGKGEIAVLVDRSTGAAARRLLWKNVLLRPIHLARLHVLLSVHRMLSRYNDEVECRIQIHRSRGILEQSYKLLTSRD